MLSKNSKVYITGHKGMVGSAVWRLLTHFGYTNLIGKSSKELDLRNQAAVAAFVADGKKKWYSHEWFLGNINDLKELKISNTI